MYVCIYIYIYTYTYSYTTTNENRQSLDSLRPVRLQRVSISEGLTQADS